MRAEAVQLSTNQKTAMCVKLSTESATDSASITDLHENWHIGQVQRVIHENYIRFAMAIELQGQIRGQETGNGVEPKVTV